MYADSLVPTVRRALTDELSEVREAAAETFDNLHSNIGQRALDEILPVLLKQLVGVLYRKIHVHVRDVMYDIIYDKLYV